MNAFITESGGKFNSKFLNTIVPDLDQECPKSKEFIFKLKTACFADPDEGHSPCSQRQ